LLTILTGNGRLVQRSPQMQPGSMNGFNYVEGNPVNETDPSGLGPIHDNVVIRYALQYGLWPEKILPFTIPPNKSSWRRQGKRVDLIDMWINFEIYEVEEDAGGYFPPGHGPDQIKKYLDLMNGANKGNGWIVNNWKPGNHVGDISFSLLDGLLDVYARPAYSPGIIAYKTQINRDALRKLLNDACYTALMAMAAKKLAEQERQPPPSSAPAPVPVPVSQQSLQNVLYALQEGVQEGEQTIEQILQAIGPAL